MSEHGAALQTFNQELVKCLEDLKVKRKEVLDIIHQEEQEKAVLERKISTLQEQLQVLTGKLESHKMLCESYEKTIKEAEMGFRKILESSRTLLQVVQHETCKLEGVNDGKDWNQTNRTKETAFL